MFRIPQIRFIAEKLPIVREFSPVLACLALSYIKRLVRSETHHLIEEGKLLKPDECEFCGSPDELTAHHFQYDLEGCRYVEFLCRACHDYVHRKGNEDCLY